MKKNKLNDDRKFILHESLKLINNNGWNDNLFELISKQNNIDFDIITSLFPDGYKDLLKYYFDELNHNLTISSQKFDFTKIKTHKKVRELIYLRLLEYKKEKDSIRRAYFTLLLPTNSKIFSIIMFRIVDQIWFLAGDKSTDFNYYSKRGILFAIYYSSVMFLINNDFDIKKTLNFLDAKLQKVSKIPNIKSNLKKLPLEMLKKFNFFKDLKNFKQ